MHATDFIGQPIIPPCWIAYPVRRGSSMWLQKMFVQMVEQTSNGTRLAGYNAGGHRVRVSKLENVIVLPDQSGDFNIDGAINAAAKGS